MYVANCGGLKYDPTDFTMVNRTLTSATQPKDVWTPTYSTGVTAKFDADAYAEKIGKETTVFTATVVDTTVTWNDGSDDVTEDYLEEAGISDIAGVVDGSKITITYSVGSEPRTELVGTAFEAKHCGGILLDGGVFAQANVNGKSVVTLVGETPTDYIVANCTLLVDKDKFKLTDSRALSLK